MELADNRGYFGFSDFGYLPLFPKFTRTGLINGVEPS